MIRPNRQIRALIGDKVGEAVVEGLMFWNDRGQDDMSSYGVPMSEDEAKAQDEAYLAIIEEEGDDGDF